MKTNHSGVDPENCPECAAEIAADPIPCKCPSQWLYLTLKEAEYAAASGRMTPEDFERYRCAWYTGAPRFGDYYGMAHPSCLAALGRKELSTPGRG